MSWQDEVMCDQEYADSLEYTGEAEWRKMFDTDDKIIFEKKKN